MKPLSIFKTNNVKTFYLSLHALLKIKMSLESAHSFTVSLGWVRVGGRHGATHGAKKVLKGGWGRCYFSKCSWGVGAL